MRRGYTFSKQTKTTEEIIGGSHSQALTESTLNLKKRSIEPKFLSTVVILRARRKRRETIVTRFEREFQSENRYFASAL